MHIHSGRGGELVGVAVEVGLEGDAVFGDFAEVREAEDLETAGIGEDGPGPGHEAVQAAELTDEFVAGAEEEVVSVAEDDRGAQVFPKVALSEAFDGALSADGHEDRGGDIAVFGVQDAGAGPGEGAFGLEFKGDLAGQV